MSLDTSGQIADAAHRAFDGVSDLLGTTDTLRADDHVVLVGEGASLDSLGFVNFIELLEEELARALGRTISVTNILSAVDEADGSPLTLRQVVRLIANQVE